MRHGKYHGICRQQVVRCHKFDAVFLFDLAWVGKRIMHLYLDPE
jgi:hypothetical protein